MYNRESGVSSLVQHLCTIVNLYIIEGGDFIEIKGFN